MSQEQTPYHGLTTKKRRKPKCPTLGAI